MRCSAPNCHNDTKTTNKSQGITFHLFPREPNLRTSWVEALGVPDWEPKERSALCSEHFRNEDFYLTKTGLRKIKDGAVPVVTQDSTVDLEAPAALRVCRICLAMDVKMYNLKDHKLDYMYETLTGIMTSDDRLPRRICWECAARISTAIRFRSRALNTNSILQDLLRTNNYIKIRDIKSVNRQQLGIKSPLIRKIFNNCDYDVLIRDPLVKVEAMPEEMETTLDDGVEVQVKDLNVEIEVKDLNAVVKDEATGSSNEIFFEEFVNYDDDHSDDDNKTLSQMCKKKKVILSSLRSNKKQKERVRPVKKIRPKKSPEDDSPNATMDRYKTNDVKRRRQTEGINESLFTITTLSYDQQIQEIAKRQESSSYINAPFKCEVCYRGFNIQDRYTAHFVRHSEASGAFECFICKTRLKTSRALRKHLTALHTEQYSCKGCPFITRNRGVAREHEKWHAGTKYQCPHCASEFDKITTYLGHIRIKHVSDFVCELCGYTFVSKKGIYVHKKKKHKIVDKNVTLEGPYCDVCEIKFVSEEAHDRHLKLSSKHSSEHDPNRIRNDSQSMNTERNGRVVRRIERRPVIHPKDSQDRMQEHEPNTPVNCEQCGIQLRDLRLYAQHFRRAHPDKNRTKYPAMKTPCMCEQCGKIFQSMALLKDHMWVHTGEKRFKCERCSKSFTQKTNLVYHMRVHSGSRPTYECPLCGKHFAFFNNRRRHMFIHTGLKPFKCETCGKCFTTSGEQRAHIEHVHLKKPWPKRARQRRDWKCDVPTVED